MPEVQAPSAAGSGAATPHAKGAVPPEVKRVIKDNMKQVLNKLGNITDVIVKKNNELKGEGKDTSSLVRSLDEAHVVLEKLDILK